MKSKELLTRIVRPRIPYLSFSSERGLISSPSAPLGGLVLKSVERLLAKA